MIGQPGQSADIDPRLYQNILKAPWGINFKYNGEVHHNLDRIWVVTEVPLPNFNKIKLPEWDIAENCSFITDKMGTAKDMIKRIKAVCMAYQPVVLQYREQSREHKATLERLLKRDLHQIIPKEDTQIRKRSVIGLVSGVVSLVTIVAEAISSHLKGKRDRAIANSLKALHETDHLIEHRLHQFKEEFLMYGKYSLESVEEIVETIHSLDRRLNLLQDNLMSGYIDYVDMYLRSFTDVQDWTA